MMTRTFSHQDLLLLDDLAAYGLVLQELAEAPDLARDLLPAILASASRKVLAAHQGLYPKLCRIITEERGSV